MKVMTGPTAIVVDGTDRPAHDGNVAFRVGAVPSVEQPRRPGAGLAIAVVTAVVTMGAMGPRPASEAGVAAACPAPDSAPATDLPPIAPTAARPSQEALPRASATPWWLLPRESRWVDPATGMTVHAPPVAHEHERVSDDRPRDR